MTRQEVIWEFLSIRKQTAQRLDLLWGIHTHGIHLTSRGRRLREAKYPRVKPHEGLDAGALRAPVVVTGPSRSSP